MLKLGHLGGKQFRNTRQVLKDTADEMERSCEKCTSITYSQGGNKYSTNMKRRKATWIGHILHWNCLLQHGTEGKTEGMGKMRKKTREATG